MLTKRINQLIKDYKPSDDENRLNFIYIVLKLFILDELTEQETGFRWNNDEHDDHYREIDIDGNITHFNRFCGCCPGWQYDSDYKECDVYLGNIFVDGIEILNKKVSTSGEIEED